ncbi:hypothetical protein AS156_29280 [Bradyrhizobium macuxiense]|uniref:Peptidase M66-like protein n=1 Tax=Bradyrhizobium macuxiense TaxID=1755647 RepID=A0A109K4K6_9BRAD|nr:hypothetical protein [Bradyrhizobium macuxiense]KWV60473.1 hypothetical protein AS156_29280 [Bradyrhizobium macuxiense]
MTTRFDPEIRMGLLATQTVHPGAQVNVLGTEICQTIQSPANDVPLVRGKRTLVRVYVGPTGFTGAAEVQGEIEVAPSAAATAKYVASTGTISVKATAYPDLNAQRRDIRTSLNFILPADVLSWSSLTVRVKRLFAGGSDIPVGANAPVTVSMIEAAPLRIKAIGLRYLLSTPGAPPKQIAPAAYHFDYLRSFLDRAYPVSTIEWSQLVVQADPRLAPPFSGPTTPDGNDPLWLGKLNIAHNQLSAIRAKDLDAGTDPRTHYYGLISDADQGLFFRGAAKDIPQQPNPSIVAVGPTGNPAQYPSLSWDTERSYGGWYGSHELGHTFGRYHPGFCNQDASDPSFPYADGRIGDVANGDMIGVDMGDPSLGIPMRVMANESCHDIMTYCDNQWISAYSYRAILDRLSQEDTLFAPVAGA